MGVFLSLPHTCRYCDRVGPVERKQRRRGKLVPVPIKTSAIDMKLNNTGSMRSVIGWIC